MKRLFMILSILALLCSPTFAGELKKISLDDATTLGTTIQTDLQVKTEGKGTVWIDDVVLSKEPLE